MFEDFPPNKTLSNVIPGKWKGLVHGYQWLPQVGAEDSGETALYPHTRAALLPPCLMILVRFIFSKSFLKLSSCVRRL